MKGLGARVVLPDSLLRSLSLGEIIFFLRGIEQMEPVK